jgi:iron(II)-dependent oxidoreductase
MPMTSRQRVLAAINHEEPDRVPIIIGASSATSLKARLYRRLKSLRGIVLLLWIVGFTTISPSCSRFGGITPSHGVNPELANVPAGWFWMGEDDGRQSNQPRHKIYLDAFEIMKKEVTREEFARFVSETGYQPAGWEASLPEETAGLPAVGVLWKDADACCRWLGLRLPSEAEWEKAARGDDGRRYPWGDAWDPQKANTAERGVGEVINTGSIPEGASPYGLLDMCGNAAEWVSDYYEPDYYTVSPERNPTGPELIMDHVLRGGSFDSTQEQATTYFRDSSHSVRPNPRVGFRCARSISGTPAP